MSGFEIDKRISAGNIIVVIGMVAGILMGWQELKSATENLNDKTSTNAKAISSNEARIRSVEYTTARQDERLILILDSLRKIEAKMDRADEPR